MIEPTLEAIAAPKNIKQAIKRVAVGEESKKTKSPGIGVLTPKHLKAQESRYTDLVSRKLRNGTWTFLPAKHCEISKGNGKTRTLMVPTTLDRVVEHAILSVIEPLWDPTFSQFSYAFRANPPGEKLRGQHPAMRQVLRYMKEGKTSLVDMDLKAFFDTMDRSRLYALLRERIEDERILQLLTLKLQAGVLKKREWVPTFVGVPQGGPLSPFLSNVYLDELDRTLTERGHHFVRYADDFRIMKPNHISAKRTFHSVKRLVEGKLRLKVNQEKSSVGSAHGSCFLGFETRLRGSDIEVLMSEKVKRRRDAEIAELRAKGDKDGEDSYSKALDAYFSPLLTNHEAPLR